MVKTPYHSKSGKLQFPWKPTMDRVFIYPNPPAKTFIAGGKVLIPETLREENEVDGWGVLLAAGPGYFSKAGKWNPTDPQLVPGSKVYFDKTVPWRVLVPDKRGKKHVVVLCGILDVMVVVGGD